MSRLSLAALAALPPTVAKPAWDPRQVGIGIVHLGIGAFHRAQTAVYSDDALAVEGGAWGICGVSLRAAEVRDRLAPQDGLYTAVEKSPSGVRRRVIGSVREVLFLGDERDAVQARLIAPSTRIVSLTITEKGYCHDPATGKLNFNHPDIVHDLAEPRAHTARSDCSSARSRQEGAKARLRSRSSAATTCRTTVSWREASCSRLPPRATPRLRAGSKTTHAFRRPWSTVSCRRQPAPTSSTTMPRLASTMRRRSSRAIPAMGHRGGFCQRPPGMGSGRCADGRRCRAVRGDEAAAAQRQPFDSGLPRLPRRFRVHLPSAAQTDFALLTRRLMREEVAPTLNRPPASTSSPTECAAGAIQQSGAAPSHAADRDGRLAETATAAACHGACSGRRRSINLLALAVAGWMRYVLGIDERGRAYRGPRPAGRAA